jgi:8-oxo-dGTP pyrophosphatase MutT (NUDIX family)
VTGQATPIPAGTVIVLRDGTAGLEVLMLRRAATLAFAAGNWVFPGGRV